MNCPIVARLLLPDDANPAGNVHGGTTLKLMEEAGMIAATRHIVSSGGDANKESEGGSTGAACLVRFDHMAFHKPIFVGDVASCNCEIIFASERSILVEAVVTAEDLSNAKTRVTNTGWLWYVLMVQDEEKVWKVGRAPPMPLPEEAGALRKYKKAKARYEQRKSSSQSDSGGDSATAGEPGKNAVDTDGDFETFKSQYTKPAEGRSPAESEQVLCQMVLPGDCSKGGIAFGGFVMKLMDSAAGCSAWRHCRTNVVTVAISDMDFVSWIRIGDLCTIRSKVVFVSSKSLEIEVVASVSSIASKGKDVTVAKGLFTFVSLGKGGKVQAVPKLVLESEEDMRNAFQGLQKYEAAKRARLEGRD